MPDYHLNDQIKTKLISIIKITVLIADWEHERNKLEKFEHNEFRLRQVKF